MKNKIITRVFIGTIILCSISYALRGKLDITFEDTSLSKPLDNQSQDIMPSPLVEEKNPLEITPIETDILNPLLPVIPDDFDENEETEIAPFPGPEPDEEETEIEPEPLPGPDDDIEDEIINPILPGPSLEEQERARQEEERKKEEERKQKEKDEQDKKKKLEEEQQRLQKDKDDFEKQKKLEEERKKEEERKQKEKDEQDKKSKQEPTEVPPTILLPTPVPTEPEKKPVEPPLKPQKTPQKEKRKKEESKQPETRIQEPKNEPAPVPESTTQTQQKTRSKETKEPFFVFDFKDENLSNIVNILAAKKNANIVLPQGIDAIKTTVTFDQKKKITLQDAEKYVDLFLDLAGYMTYQTNGFNVITKKTDNNEGHEPLHLYVNVPPNELPHSSKMIRAIYYLSNIPVPQRADGTEPISKILSDIVGAKKFLYDPKSNGIILFGNADKISSAMNIILALDATGSPETLEVFPLFHADATAVEKILQELIATNKKTQGPGKSSMKNETGFYFTPNTHIFADTRTNSLIIMGAEAAVRRIKTFIREYMDLPLEDGESLLRVYDIQYLDSGELEGVLKRIIQKGGTQSAQEKTEGVHRFLEDVVIVAQKGESNKSENRGSTTIKAAEGAIEMGGNRILVAAKKEDQAIIKDLIQKLDRPELQIIIEVMILDITLEGNKIAAAQTRNPVSLQLPGNITFENANIAPQITGTTPPTPPTNPSLVTDLLSLLAPSNTSIATVPGSSGSNIGSMIISFKDPCQNAIWSVLQILDTWTTTSIISHPFLVTKNNVKAQERIATIRRGEGREVASGGVTTIKTEDFSASVTVDVTPRASSLDRLNLQIKINIENFINPDPTTYTTAKRSVETNANISSGQILVLGGLIREVDLETERKLPIIGDIPIFGQLFRGISRTKIKNNLAIMIHPTVVQPKFRSGQNRYTDSHIKDERSLMTNEELFSSSKDPIVRWFFSDMGSRRGSDNMNNYLNDVHYQETHNEGTFNPIDLERGETVTPARAIKVAAVNE